MKSSTVLRFAALCGMFAVVLGAFAAHGLKAMIDEKAIAIFDTGTKYQMYHSLALLLTALLMQTSFNKLHQYAAYCFLLGMLFFSGSLYLLAIRSLLSFDFSWLGPITPIGGLFFIMGWLFLFFSGTSLAGKQNNS